MHKEMTLAPEWEVVIINALSKLGDIGYEMNFGGSCNPDIWFRPYADTNQSLVVDITTISDKGFDANNPIEALRSQVIDRVAACGLRLNSFHFKVEATQGQKYRTYHRFTKDGRLSQPFFEGGKKTQLKLPALARFGEKIFDAEFDQFLKEIQRAPAVNRDHVVYSQNENTHLTISYRPRDLYSTTTHPQYKQIAHISENQIYQALDDKANQLVNSSFEDRIGIILCDGDYTPFHQDPATVDEVVKYFLQNRSEINFVLTIKVKRRWREESIVAKIYRGQYFELVGSVLIGSLERMIDRLPAPENDTCNAINHLKSPYAQEGSRRYIVTTYKNNTREVRIPTRMLMELFSGKLLHSDFSKLHKYVAWEGNSNPIENPFAVALNKGWMITDVKFESHAPDEDNDVIIITFETRPDAAIHPFVVPPPTKNS
jgi:hypothetical protein